MEAEVSGSPTEKAILSWAVKVIFLLLIDLSESMYTCYLYSIFNSAENNSATYVL